jgi:hypothetical protein
MRNSLSKGLRLSWVPALLLAFGLIPANAFADLLPGDPVGGTCGKPTATTGFTVTVDVFENSTPQAMPIGHCVDLGTLALLENASGNVNDPSTWSDLAVFAFDGTNYTVTLLAPGQFGSITSADLGILEDRSGVTSYTVGCVASFICAATTEITYNFNSPEEVPEPATLSLACLGLAVALYYGLKRVALLRS